MAATRQQRILWVDDSHNVCKFLTAFLEKAGHEVRSAYGKWRDFDPEDTVRFYALRMNEVELIKSSPQKIIAQGTDWRFLRELKKELKA